MPVYEKRTYTVIVGKMPEVIEHYTNAGWPALEAGGYGETGGEIDRHIDALQLVRAAKLLGELQQRGDNGRLIG